MAQIPATRNPRQAGVNGLQQRKLTPRAYFRQHWQALAEGVQQLLTAPLASMLTILVISIALVLPMGLLLLLNNAKSLAGNWQQAAEISVYLQPNISENQVTTLVQTIKARSDVTNVNYISPDQGLKTLEQVTGFQQMIDALNSNPLPGVLEVTPSTQQSLQLSQLQTALQQLPAVTSVQLDMQWVQRLQGLLELADRIVYSLLILLAAGVLLIVGNTIRLAVQKYRYEILVIKLTGGSDAYIRRPFLYAGITYGLIAAIIAWVLLVVFVSLLSAPVANLVTLYGSTFQFHGVDAGMAAYLLFGSMLFGFIGSWLVVGAHLSDAEPEF